MSVNIILNGEANATSPSFDGKYLTGLRPALRSFKHGDAFTISGSYGTKNSVRTFLGGATGPLENTAINATPANIETWTFNNAAGNPVTIVNDPIRGKVVRGITDGTQLNSAIRYQIPGGMSENTKLFTTHVAKGNVRRDGVRFSLNHQTKHFRFNYLNSISDSNPDAKWHTWEENGSSFITTNDNGAATLYGSFQPKNDNTWYRMELFINPGTEDGTNGRLLARVHLNGVTYITSNAMTYGAYTTATRHTSYVEQYYYGNFNGHSRDGEFTVGSTVNNHTYRVAATGWAVQYISSNNATEIEILNGIRDAVLNEVSNTRTAFVTGSKVIISPIDPNDIFTSYFYNNGGSANSIVNNSYFEAPTPTTRESYRDDQCVQKGNNLTDGWERIELRSSLDEANSKYREQQVLSTWNGNIDGIINVGGLPKGRHELYLCAISDIDAAGKDVIAYSELVAITVN